MAGQVLRAFHNFCKQAHQAETDELPFAYPPDSPSAPTPVQITGAEIHAYLNHRGERNLSASWIGMNLRHSFALHALEDGMNPRALQEVLGHRSVETTLVYQRCLLPPDAISPLDLIPPEALNPQLPEPEAQPGDSEPINHRSHPILPPRKPSLRTLISGLHARAKRRASRLGHPPPRPPD